MSCNLLIAVEQNLLFVKRFSVVFALSCYAFSFSGQLTIARVHISCCLKFVQINHVNCVVTTVFVYHGNVNCIVCQMDSSLIRVVL